MTDVVKIACVMPVTQEMLNDAAPIGAYLDEQFDRWFNRECVTRQSRATCTHQAVPGE